MKTFLPAAVIVLFASVPAAQAGPSGRWHVEEHASSAEAQGRSIRRAIVSAFSVSRDYPELRREADELVRSLDTLHDAVHSGRSPSTLRSLVDNAQRQVRDLDRRVTRSDYTFSSPGYYHLTPTGYVAAPPTVHPGSIHVGSIHRMLDELSSNLHQLELDLQPVYVPVPRPYVYGYGPYGYGSYGRW
jgi:hypothetical protein